MAGRASSARSNLLDRANLFLALAAGVSLLFMVVLIAVGVVLRFAFALPILGINEIVQLNSVVLVMLALPWATAQGVHVRVDVLDSAIGRRGRFAGDVLSRLLSAFVLSILVWRSGAKALDALRYGDATNMLSLPIWPFYAILSAGIALCVLVLLGQLIAILGTGLQDE
jgi:TRAP-type C4-dicarboxylate transport system permease small subunit